jgi:hypothetical protein
VLLADAATSGASALLLTFGAEFLAGLLGVPAAVLRFSGLSLFPFAAFVTYLATREDLNRRGVWTVVVLNVLWTVDSVLLLLSGWVEPTTLGTAFVLAQAVVVAAFAEAQVYGLRRSALPAA